MYLLVSTVHAENSLKLLGISLCLELSHDGSLNGSVDVLLLG